MKQTLLLVYCFLLVCCQSNHTLNNNYVQCDSLIFIKNFPQTITLNTPDVIDIKCYGAVEVNIIDSLLITQKLSGPFFHIYNLNTKRQEGAFINKGNGPGEFIISKRISALYDINDQYLAEIYYDDKNSMEIFNISESILQNKPVVKSSTRKPQKALGSYFINDSLEYIYNLNEDFTQIKRFIKTSNSPPKEIESVLQLNNATVRGVSEINLLTSVIAINRDKLLVVEAPLAHNQVNLYSIADNSVSLTICMNDKLVPIENLRKIDKNDIIRYYGNIRGYDDFFVALYVEKSKSKQNIPSLHFFSWDGKPIVCVKLSEICDSFDIDFINKKLITLDNARERFLEYDISFISEITSQ